jgi:hypothetical protein
MQFKKGYLRQAWTIIIVKVLAETLLSDSVDKKPHKKIYIIQ